MKTFPPLHFKALEVAERCRKTEAELLDLFEQIEKEDLHLTMGFGSIYEYATECLNLSADQTYAALKVIRKSKEVPELRQQVESGELLLSKARRIAPVITKENKTEWIEKAKSLPKAKLEQEIARICPEAAKKEVVQTLTEDRKRLHLDMSEEIFEKLKRAQLLLMSKKRKNISMEECLGEVLEAYLGKVDPMKKAQKALSRDRHKVSAQADEIGLSSIDNKLNKKASRMIQRRIPSKTKHLVFQSAKGGCEYKGHDGKICNSKLGLEIHHLRSWAQGGSHEVENLMLLCGAHHQLKHAGQRHLELSPH